MYGSFTIESLGKTEEYAIVQPTVSVGRGDDNDLTLRFPTVSLHHARLVSGATGCRIMDLGSANGTRLNGTEIPVKEEQALRDGDLVEIPPFTLRFHAAPAPAAGRGPGPAVAGAEAALRSGRTIVLPQKVPPRLVVSAPEWSGELRLDKEALTFGRGDDNDLVVPAAAVSRHHARLERRGSTYLITDLGSSNGIAVDGQLVQQKLLEPGDELAIGRTVTLKYLPAEDAAAELAAAMGAAAAYMPELEKPQVYDVREGESLVLGRGAETAVHLPHPQVSAEHAQLRREQGQYVIQDLGSSAGTFVNGQLVSQQALREGDVIRIGPNQLVIRDGRLQIMSEEGRLRLDAFHLSRTVGKGKRILNDVSLSIKPQEFVAVVGGSGAGKSTLVTALCGFKPASEGAVLLNGVDLYHNFTAYRSDMGYVPQDDILHVDLTIRKALDYAARLRMPADTTEAERTQRVNDVIKELDLEQHADKRIRQLSGGQRKRASIGVELLTRPSLFFLDEATSGLDPNTETQMMKLLRKLADQGRTVVLITHATKNVMMCDKVCFLARGGYLGFYGPPEEALVYFGVTDFDQIYEKLDNVDTPEEWARRFLASAEIQKYVVTPLTEVAQGGAPAAAARGPAPPPSTVRRASAWSQFLILCRRYLVLVAADRKTLILVLALAPLLGALDFVLWKGTTFDPVVGDVGSAMSMIFMSCLMGMLVGTLGTVREIVKEKEIYKRERMVSLKLLPYVASKVAVGTLFALYSGFVLFLFRVLAVDYGFLGVEGYIQLLVTTIFVVFGGMMWGLLVSSVAPTEDRGMLLAILVIIPQIVFAGGLMPLSDLGVAGTAGGSVMATRWAMESMVTVSQVMTGTGTAEDPGTLMIPGLAGLQSAGEKAAAVKSLTEGYDDIFAVNVYLHWLWMVLIAVVLFGLILLLMKRKDILK